MGFLQNGAPLLAKLAFLTIITIVYDTYSYIPTGL